MDHYQLANEFRQQLDELQLKYQEYEQHTCVAFIYKERKVMFSPKVMAYGLHDSIHALGYYPLDSATGFEKVFTFLTQPETPVPSIIEEVAVVCAILLAHEATESEIQVDDTDIYSVRVSIAGNDEYTLDITPDLYMNGHGYVSLEQVCYFLLGHKKEFRDKYGTYGDWYEEETV